jgi:hypothetical protein
MSRSQDPFLCKLASLPNESFFSRKEVALEMTAVRMYLKALEARAKDYEMSEEEIAAKAEEAIKDKHPAATLFLVKPK